MSTDTSYELREMLGSVAEGDAHSFTRLFDKYWLQVFAHVRTYIKDSSAAEDITQDIFFGIWLNRSKLAAVQDFEPWLHVVTRNRTISGLRKLLSVPENGISDTVPEIASLPGDTPAGQLDYKQSKELLQKAIDQMPERRRQVFCMSRQEGLTHAEIAEQLQISKATVNEHITEALAFLKSKLASYPGLLSALLLLSSCWLERK